MKKTKFALALATAFLAANAYAYQITGTMEVPVNITNAKKLRAGQTLQNVTILKIQLTDKEKAALAMREPRSTTNLTRTLAKLPSALQLGMNDVPVLNQGRHGSCVTFAVTAAIDAVLGKGDYISQLCSLELGAHLEKNGYMPSGWNGSLGPLVLEQILRFGVVGKEAQFARGCAGVNEYPIYDTANTGNEMALTEFKTLSENLNERVYWTHLFSNDQVFDWKTEAPEKMREVLENVKKGLAKGHRLTLGTFLIKNGHCRGGACGNYHSAGDTWALTKGLETPPYEIGGHELVVTGYDDNAAAYDDQGGKHQGLLTLRNSWGTDVGDNGNYYMSYDYFVKYVSEVQEVIENK